MKKNGVFLWSLCATMFVMSSCSSSENSVINGTDLQNSGGKGNINLTLDFEESAGTRATASDAIPTTSWAGNIKQLQLFLYDATGAIRFSAIETINTTYVAGTSKVLNYTNVLAGTYTLVAVANAVTTESILTHIGADQVPWTNYGVRNRQVADLKLTHKPGTFPAFSSARMLAAGNKALNAPVEVFMGSATNVIINANTTTSPTVSLKREVSLMRIRLNVKEGENTNNDNTANGVDFTRDASIVVYRSPDHLKIMAGNTGGVSAVPVNRNALSIHGDGANVLFKTANPTTGYRAGGKILLTGFTDNFTMWKDIVVFPNNGGRVNDATPNANAAGASMYFVVVSGKGKVGHRLANGTVLAAEQTVYWTGRVEGRFTPNTIRECNLTLKTGGTTDVPVDPLSYGDMRVTVSAPMDWNSAIVESTVNM